MPQNKTSKLYDLEDRTLEYSKRLLKFLFSVPNNIINNNIVNQVSRSGTSLGANYREANETETKKDFVFRIRICRKEAKETIYWLELLLDSNPKLEKEIKPLMQETMEFVKIFAAIVLKSK